MREPAAREAAASALVVCRDTKVTESIIESLLLLAIRPEICEEAVTANSLLDSRKFEAVIMGLRLGEEARLVMGHLRFSRANCTACHLHNYIRGSSAGSRRQARFDVLAAAAAERRWNHPRTAGGI
jgi:cytochrome c